MRPPPAALPTDSLYVRVAQSFEGQIQSSALLPGDRLPSVRELSRRLGISVGTAIAAYEWLERNGCVVARPRSGFYVADQRPTLPEPGIVTRSLPPTRVAQAELLLQIQASSRQPDLFPFGEAELDPELLPTLPFNRALRKANAAYLRSSRKNQDPRFDLRLRRQIARLSYRQSFVATPEEVLLTNGALEAQSLALRAVTRPGDVVGVGSPGCVEVLQSVETLGLEAVEIPVHPRTGADLEWLERTIQTHGIRSLVMSGCCHSPMGYQLPDAAKAEIVALASRLGVPIVEDDCFGDLAFSPQRPRPFKAFDTDGGVLYCGTLSHLVAPAFPFGWLYPGRFRADAESLRAIASTAVATLPQLAFAEFLEAGAYERHLRKLVPILADSARRLAAAVAERFPRGTRMVHPDGGFFVWIQLPRQLSGLELYRAALEQGIAVVPGIAFSPHRQYEDCIRLSCGWAWTERAERAVETLASLVRTRVEQRGGTV